MDVRDAVEADAGLMAELTGSPTDVMRNLVHDRTVRVAQRESEAETENEDGDEEGNEMLGFVSYDAQRETVHVTQLEGTTEACERLLEEPVRFAREEKMSVELLVAESDDGLRRAATGAGFTEHGAGPRFDGTQTIRYRLDPA